MTEVILKDFQGALLRAAEEAYQNEMMDTNVEILDIKTVVVAYEYWNSDEERQEALDHCQYESKEEWVQEKMDQWLNPEDY